VSLDVLECWRKEDNVKKRILVNKNRSEKKVNPGLAKDSARALHRVNVRTCELGTRTILTMKVSFNRPNKKRNNRTNVMIKTDCRKKEGSTMTGTGQKKIQAKDIQWHWH